MTVDRALLDEAARLIAEPDHSSALDLTPLQTLAEVLAFAATSARADDAAISEVDMVELLIRLAGDAAPVAEVRKAEVVLRRLGFTAVVDRLKQLTHGRRTTLAPLHET